MGNDEKKLDVEILKHANPEDADDALKAFRDHDGEVIEMDEATNRRLVRIIDRNIMPVGLSRQLSMVDGFANGRGRRGKDAMFDIWAAIFGQ